MSPVGDVAKKRSLQKTETFKIFKTIMNETAQNLFLSEQKAKELFKAIEDRGLITPGKMESQLSDEIVQIAKEDFGVENHWGKKIVRTGINTLQQYIADPQDLMIQNGDILFFDFHPVFDGWEADLGRTNKYMAQLSLIVNA